VHTEITDNKEPIGWIYFDAECRFCVAHRLRWGSIFERRGFFWLPLQTPDAAERLGITESQLRVEMWLQLADGRKFSGVNAWSVQMRRVWWLWPLEPCSRCLVSMPSRVRAIAGSPGTGIAWAEPAAFQEVIGNDQLITETPK